MKTDQIEGLLMDHALGATTPEVAALIEGLAQSDASVRAKLQEWRGVTSLARRASTDAPIPLPEFSRMRIHGVRQKTNIMRFVAWGVGIAACVAAGFFLGHQQKPAPIAMLTTSPPIAVAELTPQTGGDFWTAAAQRAIANHVTGRAAEAAQPAANMWLQRHHLGD